MRYVIIIFFLISLSSYAQKESYSWYFGSRAAISFDTPDGEPIAKGDSQINSLEGVSSISDSSGKLMFYSDGLKIWNSNHEILNPDSSMHGHFSSTQSALIVKKPGINSIYYVFTVDAGEYVDNLDSIKSENRGLCCTVIDASLNNGSGGVIEINRLIHKPAAEKLTATVHYNNHDVWIVSHEWNSNNFISVLLTEQGIEDIILTPVGQKYVGEAVRAIGHLKFAPCGTKLATAINGSDFVEFLSFDNNTGVIYDPILIRTPLRYSNYGLEFSPNGNKLYVSDYQERTIHQYDVSILNATHINESAVRIYHDKLKLSPGGMQVAPNGKIYIAFLNSTYLSSIENPNESGSDCNFLADAVRLSQFNPNARSLFGLPNMSQGYFFMKSNLQDTVVCSGTDLSIDPKTNVFFNDMRFQWDGPNGFYSEDYLLKIDNFSENHVGKYYFHAFFRDYIISDSISLNYSITPIAKIIGDSIICSDAPIILESQFDAQKYEWSNGDTSKAISIDRPGEYVLTLRNDGHCTDTDTLVVRAENAKFEYQNPQGSLFGDICVGEEFIISTSVKNVTGLDILIKDVKLVNSSQNITILSKKSNVYLADGESFEIKLKVWSDDIGIVDDTLTFVISDFCDLEDKLPIYGRITAPNTILIQEIQAEPGEEICIPAYIRLDCPAINNLRTNLEVSVSFDANYFAPELITYGELMAIEIVDGICHVKMKFENFAFGSMPSELTRICGKILVGTDIITPIKIEDVSWDNDLFKSTLIDGSFKISSCALEIRPINYYKPANLTVVSSDKDSKLKIMLEGMTEGKYELTIYNSAGFAIDTYIYDNSKKEIFIHDYEINTSNMPTGIYFATLKSPWNFKSEKFLIIK